MLNTSKGPQMFDKVINGKADEVNTCKNYLVQTLAGRKYFGPSTFLSSALCHKRQRRKP